jgi:hypothetical protein
LVHFWQTILQSTAGWADKACLCVYALTSCSTLHSNRDSFCAESTGWNLLVNVLASRSGHSSNRVNVQAAALNASTTGSLSAHLASPPGLIAGHPAGDASTQLPVVSPSLLYWPYGKQYVQPGQSWRGLRLDSGNVLAHHDTPCLHRRSLERNPQWPIFRVFPFTNHPDCSIPL